METSAYLGEMVEIPGKKTLCSVRHECLWFETVPITFPKFYSVDSELRN